MKLPFYIKQILISFDQFCNTILGGFADETFSARCWRLRYKFPFNYLQPIVDFIMMSKTHCKDSMQACKDRKYSPIEERK